MFRKSLGLIQANVISSGLGFVALPLLASLYSPSEFGRLQLLQSTILILTVLSSLRYETLLLYVKDSEVAYVYTICIWVLLATATSLALLFALAGDWINCITGISQDLYVYVIISLLVVGFYQILNNISQRVRAYRNLSQNRLIQTTGYLSLAIATSKFRYLDTLILSDVVGKFLAMTSSYLFLRRDFRCMIKPNFKIREIYELLIAHAINPVLGVIGGVVNTIGGSLSVYMLYKFYGAGEAGLFGMAEKVTILPAALICAAISQVFTGEFSDVVRFKKDAVKYFRGIIKRVAKWSLVPFFFALLVFPIFFEHMIGGEWVKVGSLIQIMSFLLLITPVVTTINMALVVINDLKWQTAWEFMRLFVAAVGWVIIIKCDLNFSMAVMIHVICATFSGILFLVICEKRVRALQ